MNKNTLIAVVVLLALIAVYFVTREKPTETVEAPFAIDVVENLARIDVTHPGKSEVVSIEKRDELWWVTQPVEAPINAIDTKSITETFSKKINADDLPVLESKFEAFELTDPKAVKVALFSKGATTPNVTMLVGKTIAIPKTNAKRTYIKSADGKAFRMQSDLSVFRKELKALRDKTVLKNDRKKLTELTFTMPGQPKIKLAKSKVWEMVEPTDYAGMKIEPSEISKIAGTLTNLKATDFVTDKSASDLGLEPPQVTVSTKVDGKIDTIYISRTEDKSKYYGMRMGVDGIYELSKYAARNVFVTPLDFRKRIEKVIPADQIASIRFAGKEAVTVVPKEKGWALENGGMIPPEKINSRVDTFPKLRANEWVDLIETDTGLKSPEGVVVIMTKDGKAHTLQIGKTIGDVKNSRYAKWADSEYTMIVSSFVWDRAVATESDFKAEEAK